MKIEINKIPEKIGVYIFKDKNNKILYVGKSINLKKRIAEYFKNKNIKINNLLQDTNKIEILELNSEVEAILKEAELIKKFDPPYNNLLRDDSYYFYLVITKNDYPKIIITHQPKKYDILKIIGPFTEGSSLKTILKIIRKEIPFCTCLKKHKSSCLNSTIGLCYGWCCKEGEGGDKKMYLKNIIKIVKILRGDLKKIKISLLNKLEKLIINNQLEEANKVKKEIIAINKLMNHKDLITDYDNNYYLKAGKELKNLLKIDKLPLLIEAYDVSHWSGEIMVGTCATFKEGKYQKNSFRKFKIKFTKNINDPQMIYEILKRRLNHEDWPLPDIILIDGGKAQFNYALKALQENNLENYVKIISIAKPTENIFYGKNKSINLNLLPHALGQLIKNIDKKIHKLTINYHRRLRNKPIPKK
ncbi:MAG: UvrABC system protein C [Candidatus Parcubacteria bacterium]|nr:MAG: UvrABC system protein C [Candidatus Parcubacteria bacterium]